MKRLVIFCLCFFAVINPVFSQADTNTLTSEGLCTGIASYLVSLTESNFESFKGELLVDDGFQRRYRSTGQFPGLLEVTIGDTTNRSPYRNATMVLGQELRVDDKASELMVEIFTNICTVLSECLAQYSIKPQENPLQFYDHQQILILEPADATYPTLYILTGIVKHDYPKVNNIEVHIWLK